MTTVITADNGGVSGTAGLKQSADSSGILALATGTGTTAVTIDASQNVGIGTITPIAYARMTVAKAGDAPIALVNTAGGTNAYLVSDGTNFWIGSGVGSTGKKFFVNLSAPDNAATIDSSGNLLVGTTSTSLPAGANSMAYLIGQGATYMMHATGTGSGTGYMGFFYSGSNIGSISQNGTTGVLYNLTSDYRLKNDQQPLTGAKEFVMALQPKKWQWWDGSGEGVGFIAHEFMEVAKYSGHGEKDAVETVEIKDEDGNVTGTETRPIYQSIQPSSSEVMANLVSLLQEQQALITTLTERITALEAK